MIKTNNEQVVNVMQQFGIQGMTETINGKIFYSFPIPPDKQHLVVSKLHEMFSRTDYVVSNKLCFG